MQKDSSLPLLLCLSCNRIPKVTISHYKRGFLNLKCQCGLNKNLMIKNYLTEMKSKNKEPLLTTQKIYQLIDHSILKHNIKKAYDLLKKLNQIKDEEYNKLKDLFDPYLKIKNQIKEAYIKYFDENRMILLIIENMIDNYNKYPNDINTESNLVLNGSISIVEFDPRDTKAEKRLQKKNPEEYSKLKIKKLLDYLKKNSVIDYSLTKIKTIDINRIKQIAYINNNNLLLCFEETTDSLLTLNVYNPLNDFNLETSFTFKEKVEHI